MTMWNTVIDNGKMLSQGFQIGKSEKNTTNKNINIKTNMKKRVIIYSSYSQTLLCTKIYHTLMVAMSSWLPQQNLLFYQDYWIMPQQL